MAGRGPRNPQHGSIGQLTSRMGQTNLNQGQRATTPTNVVTNYFRLDLSKLTRIYSYTLTSKTDGFDKLSRRLIRQAVLSFLGQHKPPVKAATNYSNLLVTAEPLPPEYLAGEKTFMLLDEDDPPEGNSKSRHYTFSIGLTADHEVSQLLAYLANPQANTAQLTSARKDEFMSVLNIMFSHYPSLSTIHQLVPPLAPKITQVGGFKFFSLENTPAAQWTTPEDVGTGALVLGRGLEARTGFFRSVRCSSSKQALVNINRVTTAFYRPIKLSKLIQEYYEYTTAPPRANSRYNYATLADVDMFIRGLRVKTTYFGRSKAAGVMREERIYTIRGLALDQPEPTAEKVMFEWEKDGKKQNISLVKYFKQNHGLDAQPDGFVVVAGYLSYSQSDSTKASGSSQSRDSEKQNLPKKPLYIPAEYCEVLSGQPYKKVLPSEQVAIMIKFAAKKPDANRSLIQQNGLRLFGITTGASERPSATFGLELSTSMLEVKGRLLRAPSLFYKGPQGDHRIDQGQTKSDTYSLRYYFDEFRKAMSTYGLSQLRELRREANDYASHRLELRNATDLVARESQREAAIQTRFDDFVKKGGVSLLFVFINSKSPELYSYIKRMGDVKTGLITICAVSRMNRDPKNGEQWWGPKADPTTIANYMMKVNLKLGGTNQMLKSTMPPGTNRTMFMGMDVTHPGPQSLRDAPSIVTVVATIEGTNMGQWPASIRAQMPDPNKKAKEIIDDLKAMVIERLYCWRNNNNNHLPDRVIVYRDGVGEGQFDLVLQEEIPQIRDAFRHVYGANAPQPKLLHMCAIKRHHTRLYPKELRPDICDTETRNFLPGLLVDTGITYETGHDWFLQSQAALQGTAVPTHYKILENELGDSLSITEIQQMTHDMCFIFGRCTKSVSIHPAAYYADIACERVRVWMRRAYTRYPRPGEPERYDAAKWTVWTRPHPRLASCMWYI